MKKILTYDEVAKAIKAYRDLEYKIVLTQGTYDLVHVGHGRYLEAAKKEGDILIVGVDSDEKVRKRKGEGRPIVPEEERVEMLTYLKSVDHVVVKPLSAPKWELIKIVHPDVLVATKATYTPAQLKELKKYCGEIKVLEPKATTSTSAKIRLMQMRTTKKLTKELKKRLLEQIEAVVNELT
ncbi:adenylyltransferase/cytidyltransferase family protein [bacterium]|nr:adenylyltransferase/cytidyltransferase family protein [bacterium]MBQ6436500.1 adenylyltransferase/cytidyltransferase family protein [bacterium]